MRSHPAPRQPYEPEAPASAWKSALGSRAGRAIRSHPAPRQPYEPEAPASAWQSALGSRAGLATRPLARRASMGRRPRMPEPMGVPGKSANRTFAKDSARTTARAPKASSQRHVLAALGLTCDDTFWGRADLQRNLSPCKRLRVTTLIGRSFRSGGPGFVQKFQQPQPRIVGRPTQPSRRGVKHPRICNALSPATGTSGWSAPHVRSTARGGIPAFAAGHVAPIRRGFPLASRSETGTNSEKPPTFCYDQATRWLLVCLSVEIDSRPSNHQDTVRLPLDIARLNANYQVLRHCPFSG